MRGVARRTSVVSLLQSNSMPCHRLELVIISSYAIFCCKYYLNLQPLVQEIKMLPHNQQDTGNIHDYQTPCIRRIH